MNNTSERDIRDAIRAKGCELACVVLYGYRGGEPTLAERAAWDHLGDASVVRFLDVGGTTIAAAMLGCEPSAVITDDRGESFHTPGSEMVVCFVLGDHGWPVLMSKVDREKAIAERYPQNTEAHVE